MHDFLTSGIGYWENIGSRSQADLPNVDTSHDTYFLKLHC